MTRPFIRRVTPHLSALGRARPLSAGPVLTRKPPPFTPPPSDPWKDPNLRPVLWTGLGITLALCSVLEYYYPTPPSDDAFFLAVATQVAWDAVKGRTSQVRSAKAETSQAAQSTEAGAKGEISQAPQRGLTESKPA
ncbi:hypothetical protein K466DRAFT_582259 [Polyporus arcularius HHB13444]|uniref:Uncharacterized protein n=1 Tax=Polyporus arcularius HHB13444 TaxID=1314778 RepID=A0A5C3PRD3_9APHY|nr:hypothetical protein K466DRAFT_582259 [Polyporus arcularius HHB13444]